MRPSTGEMEFISRYPIDQEPIRCDVRVAIAFPIPFQRMILIDRRKLFAGDQKLQNPPKLF
jgi:hypothetical protein